MRSKTSCFNSAVIRKDITRFAPVWGVYTIGLVAALILMLANGGEGREYWPTEHLMEWPYFMGLFNFAYALLNAQLLFGDLYSSRSCYALHAMPLRRESWHLSHVAAGLLFSLVPTAVMTLFALPIAMSSCFVNGWQIPLVLFVGINLQYLFFFGVAVFSVFCAGNRLGMIAVYGILNLGACLLYVAVHNICEPMFFGVIFDSEPYEVFSPVARFMDLDLFEVDSEARDLYFRWMEADKAEPIVLHFRHATESWGYYAVTALVGAAFLAVSLPLYRKRQLECAGDFAAFKILEPVITVLAALGAAVMARYLYQSFSNNGQNDYFLMFAAGLIIGWFAARMLLERTTRVFRKKSFLGLGALAVATAAVLGIVYLDPMGIETRIPDPEDIEYVWFGEYQFSSDSLSTPEEIEEARYLHRLGLEARLGEGDEGNFLREGVEGSWEDAAPQEVRYQIGFRLYYYLKDGSVVMRHYSVWADSEAGQILKKHYSNAATALRLNAPDDFNVENITDISLDGRHLPGEYCTREDIQSLWAAINADCAQGNMAQTRFFHTGYFLRGEQKSIFDDGNPEEPELTLYLSGGTDHTSHTWLHLSIYPDSVNTVKWLQDRGLLEAMGLSVVETDYVYKY